MISFKLNETTASSLTNAENLSEETLKLELMLLANHVDVLSIEHGWFPFSLTSLTKRAHTFPIETTSCKNPAGYSYPLVSMTMEQPVFPQ